MSVCECFVHIVYIHIMYMLCMFGRTDNYSSPYSASSPALSRIIKGFAVLIKMGLLKKMSENVKLELCTL